MSCLAYDALPTDALRERNRVLRNTYWLLALWMVPTVLGALVGVTTVTAQALSPGVSLVVFLVGAFGFMFAIERTKNSAAGVPILMVGSPPPLRPGRIGFPSAHGPGCTTAPR